MTTDHAREEAVALPTEPMDNFRDFMGRYTVVLNGTVVQQRANQPDELSFEHKSEIVDKVERLLNAAIRQAEKRAKDALIEYCSHDVRCLCSQWRQGRPVEGGGYETLYGFGDNEKWYPKGQEPECSCGLAEAIRKIGG